MTSKKVSDTDKDLLQDQIVIVELQGVWQMLKTEKVQLVLQLSSAAVNITGEGHCSTLYCYYLQQLRLMY